MVQLLIVFPVTVRVGAVPPSVKLIPVMPVAPVNVPFEKLLFWQFDCAPETDEPLSIMKVTVPPAAGFAKPVTIELLFVFLVLVEDAV